MKRAAILSAVFGAALVLGARADGPAQPAAAQPAGAARVTSSTRAALAPLVSGTTVAVYPPDVELSGVRDLQGLIVVASAPDGTTADLTTAATFTLADPSKARVAGATLFPAQDGETRLAVEVAGRRLELPVKVSQATARERLGFQNDVLPVLTRAGCNMGSCHGSSRGKDGFHLSLFGYDPQGDYERITRELAARRIDLSTPDASLLLNKATGAVRHTGGQRFAAEGEAYALLREWIAAGAPGDKKDTPRLIGIELYPPAGVLLEGQGRQALVVRARYSDGRDRDVTRFTTLISTDARTAHLDGTALVAGVRGEAWVMARYGEFSVASGFLVVPDVAAPELPPAAHWIDRLVADKLRALRVSPSPLADDQTFLRRVTLDLTGRLPEPADARAFLADERPDKRARWIDAQLARKEFAELWVMKWAERLLVRSVPNQVSQKAALRYFEWLEERLANNVPIDRVVRELLTAQGGVFDSPAVNFFEAERNDLKIAENVAQVFLGMRIQCAQCHNHPFDRWTQDDYYGWAAFFAQIGRKRGGDPREQIVFDRRGGETKHPVTKKNVAPKLLGGASPDTRGKDRRAVAAEWITSPDNPYFARNVANLVWDHLFGVGIVHEPDDVRVSNPPSNPALLDALAKRLVELRFDLRQLVREVVTSDAYQRSVVPNASNREDGRNASHARVRRLRAEVLLDALAQVTWAPNKFAGLPLGARAVRIPDGATSNYFLETFGRPRRESVCTCEVETAPNLGQALQLLNGEAVTQKIQQGARVAKLLEAGKQPLEVVDELYLACLCRLPTTAEKAAIAEDLAGKGSLQGTLEDVFWALLNSREFLFNH
ncbi:MAG: DUF1549 and DUF1553 domain-containing protein [Planctomycetota bacterium]